MIITRNKIRFWPVAHGKSKVHAKDKGNNSNPQKIVNGFAADI